MVPQGPPAPVGGAHSVPHSLLRSNSGLLGGQGGGMSSQNSFSMLVSPHSQFSGMNMLGNGSNVSSLFHQSHGSSQRGLIDGGAESNPLGGVGNGVVFNTPSSSYVSSPVTATPNSSGQVSGQQHFLNPSGSLLLMEQQQAQHLDQQNFQHNQQHMQSFSVPNGSQQQQQQYQSPRPALGGAVPVKLEQQTSNENLQQLQALRNLPPVKLEPQQLQNMRNLGPVKMESQQTDPSLFLQQQQQQILLSRQYPQAAAAAQMFHQQRLLQLQQQQQQFLKGMPHQRSPLQQQFQSQSMPLRSPAKSVYEPGMCARRLTHYMYQQQRRPEDNNIEFWRNFVAEFFAPNAKKKWCVSMYGSGRQTNGVFPQDVWHCEICNRKPGRGFEATVEVLPRLFKIKYESGTVEELLYVDMPQEYETASGQIVLEYTKAIQESVFEKLRVVRDGQLRIVFSPDLKICSWEFCALRHDELIPRRLLIPQVNQLGAAAQKYQAAVQNASVATSASDQQNYCNMFVASAHQLAKALEVPLVNDLGYTKRYIRCLQISEVVNSMKDLIEFSRETGAGPVESLSKFPRRMNPASAFQGHPQLPEGQQQHQTGVENQSNDNRAPAATLQMPSTVQGVKNVSPGCTSSGNIPGLINQNSMNFRQQNPNPATNGTYGGNGVQMSSPVSSTNVPQTQPSSSPFQSPPTPSSSNNAQATANIILPGGANSHSPNVSMQQAAHSGDADANDTQSSVQKIIHGMMMSSQHNGSGMMGNGILPSRINPVMNNGNVLAGTMANGNTGNESMGNGLDHSVIVNGIRAALGNSSMSMSGRMGMAMARERGMNPQQQDMSNQLQMLSSLGGINGFNNLHFDWKTMP